MKHEVLTHILLGGAVVAAYFTKPEFSQHKEEYPIAVEQGSDKVFDRVRAELEISNSEYSDYLIFSLTRTKRSVEILGIEKGDLLSIGVFDTIFVAH